MVNTYWIDNNSKKQATGAKWLAIWENSFYVVIGWEESLFAVIGWEDSLFVVIGWEDSLFAVIGWRAPHAFTLLEAFFELWSQWKEDPVTWSSVSECLVTAGEDKKEIQRKMKYNQLIQCKEPKTHLPGLARNCTHAKNDFLSCWSH